MLRNIDDLSAFSSDIVSKATSTEQFQWEAMLELMVWNDISKVIE